MKHYTFFAMDMHGNHFSEEYDAETQQNALDLFYKEEVESRVLFIVEGDPIFTQM